MNKAELAFKAIDIFFDLPQNVIRFPGIVRIENLAYSDKSEEYTVGDLYFKKDILADGLKHPVLLYIHGGGFIAGDKEYRVTNSEYFADKGFFVFNINHRMPPDVALPENINDCIDALNFIEEIAKFYNIDTDRIVISGDSSGAYETSFVAASVFDDELREALGIKKAKFKPAALALMCGLYDLHKLMDGPSMVGIVPEMCSMIFDFKLDRKMENHSEYKNIDYISPINFINKNWCPVFMTWAKEDFMCIDQGEPFADSLDTNGINVYRHVVEGIRNNHCYHLNLYRKTSKKCMNTCVNFLYDILGMPYEKLPVENLISEENPEAKNRRERFEAIKESGKEKFDNFRDTSKEKLEDIRESGKEKFEDIKENSKEKFEDIKESSKEKFSDIKENIKKRASKKDD